MQSLTRTLNIIILCNIGIVTLQTKHNASLIYLQKDELWYQFNPLFYGNPLLSDSSLMKASYHVWMMSKSQKSQKYFIHGSHSNTDFLMSHRNHRIFNLTWMTRIFVEDLTKIFSVSSAPWITS